jgi:hypothetical protein
MAEKQLNDIFNVDKSRVYLYHDQKKQLITFNEKKEKQIYNITGIMGNFFHFLFS